MLSIASCVSAGDANVTNANPLCLVSASIVDCSQWTVPQGGTTHTPVCCDGFAAAGGICTSMTSPGSGAGQYIRWRAAQRRTKGREGLEEDGLVDIVADAAYKDGFLCFCAFLHGGMSVIERRERERKWR